MLVYYINQLLIAGLAYPLCMRNPTKVKQRAYLLITFGYMWVLATFRSQIGYDFQTYIDIFSATQQAPSLAQALAQPYEPGFLLLNRFMGMFTHSHVVMYGVYSFLILGMTALAIDWYVAKRDTWLAVWSYVMLAYFYTMMNFIRQSLAVAIVFLGYRFLRDKKPVPYFLLVLLASCFHRTALIMIPFYFLCRIPLSKKTGIFYGVATIAAYLLSPWIMDYGLMLIHSTYRGSIYVDPQYGFSFVFLFVPAAIFVLCLCMLPTWRKRDPNADMLTNLILYSLIIWLFITHHFILERFSHYTYILSLIAVPAALRALRAPREEYDRLAELRADEEQNKAKKSKEALFQVRQLKQRISDHKKYYWSATAAYLLITWLYNEFGQHVNGFHNVFPYQSVLTWLNHLP